MNELPLYFIAIIPPDPIFSFALQQKEYIAEYYNSKAALRSPPHITLHMPFRLKESREALLIEYLDNLAKSNPQFLLKCDGFGAFEPRVIYINLDRPDALVNLQRNIGQLMKQQMHLFNANYKDKVFNPHMTIAFRDLRKAMFHKAWEEFRVKKYTTSFMTDSFALLKHDSRHWQVHQRFHLSASV